MRDYKFDTFYYSEDKSNEHHLSEIENLSAMSQRHLIVLWHSMGNFQA